MAGLASGPQAHVHQDIFPNNSHAYTPTSQWHQQVKEPQLLSQESYNWPLLWQLSGTSPRLKISRVSIYARVRGSIPANSLLTVNSEHIWKIRKFIRSRKETAIIADGKFFDSVSFWQKAYEESQTEQTKLLNTIYELEQRNQSLLAKVNKEFPEIESKPGASSKRKAGGTGTLESSDAAKKRSRGRPTKNESSEMDEEIERE